MRKMQRIADTTEEFSVGYALSYPTTPLERFTDAKQAGAAFYHADEKRRPYVIHTLPDGSARTMAGTGIHGQRENGTNIFVKSFPCGSYSADANFIAGYREAAALPASA